MERKEGGIVNKAYDDSRKMLQGVELETALMNHFKMVNCTRHGTENKD